MGIKEETARAYIGLAGEALARGADRRVEARYRFALRLRKRFPPSDDNIRAALAFLARPPDPFDMQE